MHSRVCYPVEEIKWTDVSSIVCGVGLVVSVLSALSNRPKRMLLQVFDRNTGEAGTETLIFCRWGPAGCVPYFLNSSLFDEVQQAMVIRAHLSDSMAVIGYGEAASDRQEILRHNQ